MFARISLRQRMLIIGIAALLGMLAVGLVSAINQRSHMYEERQEMLKALVESAKTQVDFYAELQKSGQLPEKEAQDRAREALRAMRFQGGNYFFMYTYDGLTILLPPTPEKEGTSRIDVKDVNGVPLIRNLIDTGKSGAGFTSYSYPRPGQTEALTKIAYSVNLPAWGWVLGAGLYVDDIDAAFWKNLTYSGIGILLLAAAVFGVIALIASSVLDQLGGEPEQAMRAMKVVAEGDLSIEVVASKPQSLLAELNLLIRALRTLVGEIKDGAQRIGSASEHIRHSSNNVAAAASNQAGATQDMAAAMEQFTVSIAHISENASETEQHASQAVSSAQLGESQVNAAVSSMRSLSVAIDQAVERINGLNSRAQEVGSIAATIKEIADQTNLLALNAAIEAARAGETGRGFAVVADEVRKLAERTSHATGQIERTLSAIQVETRGAVEAMGSAASQAGQSVEEVGESAQVLGRIAQGASHSRALVADVATAAREQRTASTSLAQRVEQVAQAAEETSYNMQETANSASELEQVAKVLRESVSRFRC